MKYTLRPYQEAAVAEVMQRLDDAQRARSMGLPTVFALCAPTGAGKTVISSAVFERLLLPSDDYEPDPKAVVLWLSDNPDLNRQSRYRIESASEELAGRTFEIKNTFNRPVFEPGIIYFLNTQKIGKGTKLGDGGSYDETGKPGLYPPRPDEIQVSIWDTIRNTINSPDHHLCMVVDEAHRGSGKRPDHQATMLRKLIEGHVPNGYDRPVPPMPVVMGVSATPGAFKAMVSGLDGSRLTLDDVTVPIDEVQDSGLIKDIIDLRIPGETGTGFETAFVREAAKLLAESSRRWEQYYLEQGENDEDRVVPLMVVQMQDKATGEDMYQVMKAVREGYPKLDYSCFAHVFGEHKKIPAGDLEVPHMEPQAVQDATWVRVLFAKTAISTGWDCPRAEVMMSYRPAKDKDHITQVIGRMVRSPLARRIEGNDLLNSVLCVLPKFDRKAATEVVKAINTGGPSEPPIAAVIDPELLTPVENAALWECFASLPREVAPARSNRPISRLLNLGIELQRDELMADGEKNARSELISMVDGLLTRFQDQVERNIEEILQVDTLRLVYDYSDRKLSKTEAMKIKADHRVVANAYRAATPVFTRALADMWVNHDVKRHIAELHDEVNVEELVTQGQLYLTALAQVDDVKELLARSADDVASKWYNRYRADVMVLPDSRKDRYNTIVQMALKPTSVMVEKPENRLVPPGELDSNKKLVSYERYEGHILVGDEGTAPFKLNAWESKVVSTEQNRSGAVGWYRNPPRASSEALTAVYFDETNNRWRNVQPDFVFFREVGNTIKASIVDPHGAHLSDALAKLRGMAAYAEKFGDQFVQILSLSGNDAESMEAVDLNDEHTRNVIAKAKNAAEVFAVAGFNYR